jgi:hypothetical protein
MNEDVVNMSTRKFLKKVGVTSQREIETALREAESTGKLAGSGPLKATVTLSIKELGLQVDIDGTIELE